MAGVCLVVAGAVAAFLPTTEFTLSWRHSVEKIQWEERYLVEADQLTLVDASIAGMGAGMEPGLDAQLDAGRWHWRPSTPPLPELRLAVSRYSDDYEICLNGRCDTLATRAGTAGDAEVIVRPCNGRR